MDQVLGGRSLKKIFLLTSLILLLAACSPTLSEAPTATSTSVPAVEPSDAPSETPTATAEPSATPTEAPTATETLVYVAPTSAFTPTVPFTEAGGAKSRVHLQNDTDETITLTINGSVYVQYVFDTTFNIYLGRGDYSVMAFIGNDGPYVGSFTITNLDKYTIEFDPGRMKIHLP